MAIKYGFILEKPITTKKLFINNPKPEEKTVTNIITSSVVIIS